MDHEVVFEALEASKPAGAPWLRLTDALEALTLKLTTHAAASRPRLARVASKRWCAAR